MYRVKVSSAYGTSSSALALASKWPSFSISTLKDGYVLQFGKMWESQRKPRKNRARQNQEKCKEKG